jgi:hypothetical protein
VKHAAPRAATKFYERRDVWWADAVKDQSTDAEVEWVEADHPLFLLYTSGSTGGFWVEGSVLVGVVVGGVGDGWVVAAA